MSRIGRPAGWLLDKSAAVRLTDAAVAAEVGRIMEPVGLCPVGRFEQLYSATSAADYEGRAAQIQAMYLEVDPPEDVFEAVLELQRDLAQHHGLWHRVPLSDLLIAVTALANNFGVLHRDDDFERIAKVRPLIQRRL